MEKAKEKEKIRYVDKLFPAVRKRYLDKLLAIAGLDPYTLHKSEWDTNPDRLPSVSNMDIVNYLVFGVSFYTQTEFRNFKALDSYKYFVEGWVGDLLICQPRFCKNTVVLTKVKHSMRVSEAPLSPWVIIDEEGGIVSAHCTCLVGVSESCSHIGSLLFKAEAAVRVRSNATATDRPAYWMLPGNKTIKPAFCSEIDYTSSSAKQKSLNSHIEGGTPSGPRRRAARSISSKPSAQDLATFYQHIHATGDHAGLLSSLPEWQEEYRDKIEPIITLASRARCIGLDRGDPSARQKYCQTIRGIAEVSEQQVLQIESRTRGQHTSSEWFSVRAGRITASNMHAVFKSDLTSPALTTVKNVCYPRRGQGNAATRWGIEKEESAKQTYISQTSSHHTNQQVKSCGVFINRDFCEVAATPDAILSCDCCGKGSLEVKCPFKYKDCTILEACANNDAKFCLQVEDGQVQLKDTHAYYSQVQTQMFVTKSAYCDLVVWTTKDYAIIRLYPNTQVWNGLLEKAQAFFVSIVLPELATQCFTVPPTATSLLAIPPSALPSNPRVEVTPTSYPSSTTNQPPPGSSSYTPPQALCPPPQPAPIMLSTPNQPSPSSPPALRPPPPRRPRKPAPTKVSTTNQPPPGSSSYTPPQALCPPPLRRPLQPAPIMLSTPNQPSPSSPSKAPTPALCPLPPQRPQKPATTKVSATNQPPATPSKLPTPALCPRRPRKPAPTKVSATNQPPASPSKPPTPALCPPPPRQLPPQEAMSGNNTTWCLCGGQDEGHMISCDNQNCAIQWFHFECVGLSATPRKKMWFCPVCEKE